MPFFITIKTNIALLRRILSGFALIRILLDSTTFCTALSFSFLALLSSPFYFLSAITNSFLLMLGSISFGFAAQNIDLHHVLLKKAILFKDLVFDIVHCQSISVDSRIGFNDIIFIRKTPKH